MRIDSISSTHHLSPANQTAATGSAAHRPSPSEIDRDAAIKKLTAPSDAEDVSATAEQGSEQKGGDVARAERSLNSAFNPHGISLKFRQDEETNAIVVEVVDQNTGETLRQIPDETMLHLASSLGSLQGRVVNRQA